MTEIVESSSPLNRIEAFLPRIFKFWAVLERHPENNWPSMIIEGDFCRLKFIRDRDFSPTGYVDVLEFAPLEVKRHTSFKDIRTLQIELGGRNVSSSLEEYLEWLVENRLVLKKCSDPSVFKGLGRPWANTSSIYLRLMTELFDNEEFVDGPSMNILFRRLEEVGPELVEIVRERMGPQGELAELIAAAFGEAPTISLESDLGIRSISGNGLEILIKDGGSDAIWLKLGDRESGEFVLLADVENLLFSSRVRRTFKEHLEFIVNKRESLRRIAQPSHTREILAMLEKLSEARERFRKLVYG
ncbi:MAG: hypothetical protein GC165_14585 [Armatimonadetes bacterium]|nr:hypothetical protein [Armatimonadota bacterium]MBS1725700.1 hypothetical protein [Armatimonadota bacterium]